MTADIARRFYMIGSFFFGNMKEEDALRSLRLFASEVMPAFQK